MDSALSGGPVTRILEEEDDGMDQTYHDDIDHTWVHPHTEAQQAKKKLEEEQLRAIEEQRQAIEEEAKQIEEQMQEQSMPNVKKIAKRLENQILRDQLQAKVYCLHQRCVPSSQFLLVKAL